MPFFKEKYMNPFTDFGFKKIFGEEINKDLLPTNQNSLKYYRDLKNSLDTAREEGELKAKREIANKLLQNNIEIELIISTTGLSEDEILQIKADADL